MIPRQASSVLIEPDWPAPDRVMALSTTRGNGVSLSPWSSLNLAAHVGDSQRSVEENRRRLAATVPLGTAIQWLDQVHGNRVVAAASGAAPEADASWTQAPAQACAVLTADCLPVLFCDDDASVVAAAHAGWRGLQGGVLDATVAALPANAEKLLAWLGPAIGPEAFEVGPDVRDAFLGVAKPAQLRAIDACFTPASARPGYFFADLYELARVRLASLGVTRVFGGGYCTFTDASRFFSYRRDGQTGRMASLIYLKPM
ncbi:MAG: peptidoglycan editing factor PgeF [Pseudomonadota bacterium]